MADQHFPALLQTIAKAIGVPVSTFTDQSLVPEARCTEPGADEITALIEAFGLVKNAEARRICIEFVRLQRTPSQP